MNSDDDQSLAGPSTPGPLDSILDTLGPEARSRVDGVIQRGALVCSRLNPGDSLSWEAVLW